MSPAGAGTLVLIITLAMLVSGIPVAFGLGAIAVIFLIIFQGFDGLHVVAETYWSGLDDFTLVAIPMFVMMGAAIGSSPAGKDLYEALDRWLYRLPGGLVVSNIGACAIFAALTGSSPACCAAIGKMGIPEMRRTKLRLAQSAQAAHWEFSSHRRSRSSSTASRLKLRSVACSSPASCRA
jgi:TRAP-type mannitol/chloroaromatic compound transport system permease large subunit